MRVIATARDICRCGHVKAFHVWLSQNPVADESVVEVGSCYRCECLEYEKRQEATEPSPGDVDAVAVERKTPIAPTKMYARNLRFYAEQARVCNWHTEGRIIESGVISHTLLEIADYLDATRTDSVGTASEPPDVPGGSKP